MDNDVLSDDELIDSSQEGVYKGLKEVFKGLSTDPGFLKNNLSKRPRSEK
jgi:hypothetical protein